MRYLIVLILFLTSCSAEWHIKKAVQKDPTIQKEIVDTLKLTKTFVDTIHTSDSTYYVEQRIVHYDTIVKYTKVDADFSEMKTWFETWQESRTDRVEIRNDRKVERTDIRHSNRTKRVTTRQDGRTDRRGTTMLVWIAVIIVLLGVGYWLFKKFVL